MFKLISLTLYGMQPQQVFTYTFTDGINYFKGKNDSGKTEFYSFLDYMFGSDMNLSEKEWYRDTLSHAKLEFSFEKRNFIIERHLSNPNQNIFRYADEEPTDYIRLADLKERINSVFSVDEAALKELRAFVEEDVSYRTFTVFNFLGETRQGVLNDFFDKCSRIEYAVKMPSILNYIFNRNISRIDELKRKEERLKEDLEKLEKSIQRNDEVRARINHQLSVLGLHIVFNGNNAETVLRGIDDLQNSLRKNESTRKTLSITELEAIYTSLDEQIKKQGAFEKDHKSFIEEDSKQKELLSTLLSIVQNKAQYEYLVKPIVGLIESLDKSISFNRYLIQESSTSELKKQREQIKTQIIRSKGKYAIYSASEKTKAVTLIKEYLNHYDISVDGNSVAEIRTQLREIRQEIRTLQNANDTDKISALSKHITSLYKSTSGVSELSEYDFSKPGFNIVYIKNGNTLQPQIEDETDAQDHKNYYTGSLARHTLIQLCGYLGFLNMLISENKYPLIPILIIDHVSKPFDHKNVKAIGAVIHEAYKSLNTSQLQIIMFDDEDATDIGITPNTSTNLIDIGKSGFNPFYQAPIVDNK